MPATARRLISLPADLNEQMKAHPEINWSEIAVGAFFRKIDGFPVVGGDVASPEIDWETVGKNVLRSVIDQGFLVQKRQ